MDLCESNKSRIIKPLYRVRYLSILKFALLIYLYGFMKNGSMSLNVIKYLIIPANVFIVLTEMFVNITFHISKAFIYHSSKVIFIAIGKKHNDKSYT